MRVDVRRGEHWTGLLFVVALALCLTSVSPLALAATGIANTRHNLSPYRGEIGDTATPNPNPIHVSAAGTPSGTLNVPLFGNDADANAEICVFCHTPHGGNEFATAPLWNKHLPGTTYTVYNSGTMQADTSNGPTAVSLACLSCHDGTQALDNVINSAGSRAYVVDGGGASGVGFDWSQASTYGVEVDVVGRMLGNGSNLAYAGAGTGTIAMLSPDLSNDHPVGIAFCGGGWAAAAGGVGTTTGACNDQDFYAPMQAIAADGTTPTFYIETAAPIVYGGLPDITIGQQKDDFRLFGTTAGAATVECASCHDPHNDRNPTFLRVSNAGSGVCLSCHNK